MFFFGKQQFGERLPSAATSSAMIISRRRRAVTFEEMCSSWQRPITLGAEGDGTAPGQAGRRLS
jgi:hypothetical protein